MKGIKLKKNSGRVSVITILLIIFIPVVIVAVTLLITNAILKDISKDDEYVPEEIQAEDSLKEDVNNSKEEKIKDIILNQDNKEENKDGKIIKTKDEVDLLEYSEEYKKYANLSEEEKKKTEVIPSREKVDIDELDDISQKIDDSIENNKDDNNNEEENVEKLPSKYSLLDHIEMKVDNQEQEGLCWCFTSQNSMETNIALKHGKNYDFSEHYIDYLSSDLLGGNRELGSGAWFRTFSNIASTFGVVSEEQVPYVPFEEEEYSQFENMKPIAYVTETIKFPNIDKESKDYTDEQIKEFRDTVKKHIMNNGSVYATIKAPQHFVNFTNNSLYNSKNRQGEYWHAVSIIGWDDNYSKENFDWVNGPTHDGAYIAMNSWGEDWGDKGLFYIYYDDVFVETDMEGVLYTSFDSEGITKIDDNPILKIIEEQLTKYIIKIDNEEYIPKSALDNIYSLNLSNKGLQTLEGIEIFKSLTSLDVSNNNISDITPLTKLNKISFLNLSNNNIKDVSIFGEIENLSTLDLSGNINIVGYENLKELYSLKLSGCGLNKFPDLEKFSRLVELDLSNNTNIQINANDINKELNIICLKNCNLDNEDLVEISKVKYIRDLDISYNNITDISPLSKMSNFTGIDISGNKNITGISTLVNEKNNCIAMVITANDCSFADISEFSKLHNLRSLSLKNCNIEDVTEFGKIEGLRILNLSENLNLKNLDKLTNVDQLILSKCELKNVEELSLLKQIRILDLSYNDLKDISTLKTLDQLNQIDVSNNKDLTLDGFASETLYELSANNCNINGTIDIEKFPKITSINIEGNNIEDISNLLNSQIRYILVNKELTKEELNLIITNTVGIIGIRGANIVCDVNIPKEEGLLVNKKTFLDIQSKFPNFDCEKYFTKANSYLIVDKIDREELKFKIDSGLMYDCNILLKINFEDQILPEKIKVIQTPFESTQPAGSEPDLDGMTVMLYYNDNIVKKIEDYTVESLVLKEGENNIKVTYNDMSTYFMLKGLLSR